MPTVLMLPYSSVFTKKNKKCWSYLLRNCYNITEVSFLRVPKTCDHVFDDKLNWNVRLQHFWHIYYHECRPSTDVFIFPPHLFCAPTLPWETVKTWISVKIKRNHEISQKHAILITNLYLSKQYDAQRLLNELVGRSWKLGSIDSLLKRIHKMGTIVW